MWGHIYINRNVSLCCHWKQHTCLQVQMTFVLYERVTRTVINTAFSLGTPEEAQSTQTCPLLNHHPHSAESTHHDISLVFPCSVGIQNWKHWLATPWTTYQLYLSGLVFVLCLRHLINLGLREWVDMLLLRVEWRDGYEARGCRCGRNHGVYKLLLTRSFLEHIQHTHFVLWQWCRLGATYKHCDSSFFIQFNQHFDDLHNDTRVYADLSKTC